MEDTLEYRTEHREKKGKKKHRENQPQQSGYLHKPAIFKTQLLKLFLFCGKLPFKNVKKIV